MIDFSRGAPKMVSADEAKREESAKLASDQRQVDFPQRGIFGILEITRSFTRNGVE
jgi:hypothetical protein